MANPGMRWLVATPPKMRKLSKTMEDALTKLRECGSLVYKKSGLWTYHGCPCHPGGSTPKWSVTTGTVRALADRGLGYIDRTKDQPLLLANEQKEEV